MIETFIGGQTYSSNDFQLVMYGLPIRSARNFTCDLAQDSEVLHGMGSADAVNYGTGKKTVVWSVEILESELTIIRNAAPNGDLTNFAPATFSGLHFNESQPLKTLKVYSAKVTNDGHNVTNTDKGIYTRINGFASGKAII